YAALESGLDRFVHLNKGEFMGRKALSEWQERGFANAMVTLEVHDTVDADATGGNPVMLPGGEVIGRATSGGYGFRLDKSLAMAMVRPDLAEVGMKLEIDILDRRLSATVVEESPYDPQNEKLRA
ncbi:MAG: glycine cleavage T C-terminal barrel domain-containing protein, partial [Pseudomonadota bacterium]|nr:glycine cleavage T C-terminal barrel domain-containing protein [Pseudomonadota bacterium]